MLKIPQSDTFWQRYPLYLIAIGLLVVLALLLRFSWLGLNGSENTNLDTAVVDKGEVIAKVSGYGRLQARQSAAVIAQVEGRLLEILRYPGAKVEVGEPLLTFTNPQLTRDKEEVELKLLMMRANFESGIAKLQLEKLTRTNDIAVIRSEIGFAEKEMLTLEALYQKNLVSSLDHLRAKTRLEQAKLKLTLAERSIEAFEQSFIAEKKALEYNLQAAQKKLVLAQTDIDHLLVKAERAGVLGELGDGVDVGNLINKGAVLANLTDTSSLFADIHISASDVSNVHAALPVIVDIRGQKVQGEVMRVHPSVKDNQVRLEVKLLGKLPAIARENLNVSAEIITAQIADTLRVRLPYSASVSHSQIDVFVQNEQEFMKQKVTVGISGTESVQIISGLHEGQQILIEVPEHLSQEKTINIKDLLGE